MKHSAMRLAALVFLFAWAIPSAAQSAKPIPAPKNPDFQVLLVKPPAGVNPPFESPYCDFSGDATCQNGAGTYKNGDLLIENAASLKKGKVVWIEISYQDDPILPTWNPNPNFWFSQFLEVPTPDGVPPIAKYAVQLVDWYSSRNSGGAITLQVQYFIFPQPSSEVFKLGLIGTAPAQGLFLLDRVQGLNAKTFCSLVPEPATWAMLVLGFGFCGAIVRHSRGQGLLSRV